MIIKYVNVKSFETGCSSVLGKHRIPSLSAVLSKQDIAVPDLLPVGWSGNFQQHITDHLLLILLLKFTKRFPLFRSPLPRRRLISLKFYDFTLIGEYEKLWEIHKTLNFKI